MELEKVFTYAIHNRTCDMLDEDYPKLRASWRRLSHFIEKHGVSLILKSYQKRYGEDLEKLGRERGIGKNKERQLRVFFGLSPQSESLQIVKITLKEFKEYQKLKEFYVALKENRQLKKQIETKE